MSIDPTAAASLLEGHVATAVGVAAVERLRSSLVEDSHAMVRAAAGR